MQFHILFSLLTAVATVQATAEIGHKDFNLSCKDWGLDKAQGSWNVELSGTCKGPGEPMKAFFSSWPAQTVNFYKGGWGSTILRLRDCFSNDNGQLVYRKKTNNGSSPQCKDWKLTAKRSRAAASSMEGLGLTILTASCIARDGSWKTAAIDINPFIGNVHGLLMC